MVYYWISHKSHTANWINVLRGPLILAFSFKLQTNCRLTHTLRVLKSLGGRIDLSRCFLFGWFWWNRQSRNLYSMNKWWLDTATCPSIVPKVHDWVCNVHKEIRKDKLWWMVSSRKVKRNWWTVSWRSWCSCSCGNLVKLKCFHILSFSGSILSVTLW